MTAPPLHSAVADSRSRSSTVDSSRCSRAASVSVGVHPHARYCAWRARSSSSSDRASTSQRASRQAKVMSWTISNGPDAAPATAEKAAANAQTSAPVVSGGSPSTNTAWSAAVSLRASVEISAAQLRWLSTTMRTTVPATTRKSSPASTLTSSAPPGSSATLPRLSRDSAELLVQRSAW